LAALVLARLPETVAGEVVSTMGLLSGCNDPTLHPASFRVNFVIS